MRISILCLCLCLPLMAAGCHDDPTPVHDMAAPDLSHKIDPLAIACTDSIDAVYTLPAGLPAFDDTHRGDVIRCAFDRSATAADVNTQLNAVGYVGPPVTNDIDIYRIAYRTKRSTPATGPAPGGFSSALVILPAQIRSDAYVVTGHGTVGMPDSCVPSKMNLLDPTNGDEVVVYDLALAAGGFALIGPDYAGYGYGQAAHGWSLAEDEAHSLLDATRAMKNLMQPSALPSKVAMIGHSQGSHAVLAAQSMAKSYGMAGELIAVAPMGLLWFSDLTWGASLSPVAGLTTADSPGAITYALFYFYGHGELYDGPGGGLAMIQPAKRDLVKSFLTTYCDGPAQDHVKMLGSSPSDFYDPAFVKSLQDCMIFQNNCDLEPAKTWKARALADRPAVDATGAPLEVWHGAVDTVIPPERAQCGFDKIAGDLAAATGATATFNICGDPLADHGGIIRRDLQYVSQWFGERAAGKTDVPGCVGEGPLEPTDGGALTCPPLPPNL